MREKFLPLSAAFALGALVGRLVPGFTALLILLVALAAVVLLGAFVRGAAEFSREMDEYEQIIEDIKEDI